MRLTRQQFPAGKRAFDITISFTLLVLLSPVLLILTIMVLLGMGWPVIFSQQRPGWRAKPFLIHKFRSMTQSKKAVIDVRDDYVRLTNLGKWMRKLSLDELPELWNVLVGDMSLVGPRPLLMSYLDRYSPEQARRHDTKPGITGWAQVNGRNTLSWEDKFRLDVWYVDNWSFWLDLKILFITLWKVIKREGISQSGEATSKEWMGN